MKTIVGLFKNPQEAQVVVNDLAQIGINRDNVCVSQPESANNSGAGDRNGGRPFGFVRSLLGLDVEDSDAEVYSEGVRRGNALVSVKADDAKANAVVDIMKRHGVMDVDHHANEWQRSGWQRGAAPATGARPTATARGNANSAEQRIPVTQEELRIGKREVVGGGVRIYTRVTEQPVQENVTLHQEHVDVQRRPVNRPVNPGDVAAFKEGVVEVTETSEQAVVQKNARVVEEVVVRKDAQERQETVRDTVRRTDVKVEKLDAERANRPQP